MSVDLSRPLTQYELQKSAPDEGAEALANIMESGVLDGLRLPGEGDPFARRLAVAQALMKRTGYTSVSPLLPLLLNLKGGPYTLRHHYPFEPFFRTTLPTQTLVKSGRQVAKSTSLAAQGLIFSNCLPHFSTLYVTPLFEMVRRFSTSYVGDFIQNSPVSGLFVGSKTVNSVLHRTFKNQAQMFFSFAFLSPDRTRGIPADKVAFDEIQDMDRSFIPVILETMSGSKWGLVQYTGTPKTLDNTIEKLWKDSSQAEWVTKCHHPGCGHWNVPALSHDLLAMIGPFRRDVSEREPGVVCGKCRKPIRPRTGHWIHQYKERRDSFVGYHLPQLVMPMHYANWEKWGKLVGKSEGRGNTPFNVFLNEVCGESCDTGSRLVTETDLKRAAVLPWRNRSEEAKEHLDRYQYRILSVDWSGGGVGKISSKRGAEGGFRELTSYTVLVSMGMRFDGVIEVMWGLRSLTPNNHVREAKLCLGAAGLFRLSHIAHDYTGAGNLRETIINNVGFPYERLVPVRLGRTAVKNIMVLAEPTEQQPRAIYTIDKPRTLQLTCHAIKTGKLLFFEDDYQDAENPGLIRDFLALVEEKGSSRLGGDVYTITKDPSLVDDFAQAVNIGCAVLWQLSGKWPNPGAAAQLPFTDEFLARATPRDADWG
jgi:hypothetical protein